MMVYYTVHENMYIVYYSLSPRYNTEDERCYKDLARLR